MMLFNSINFLIFFPIVIIFHWVLPHRFRWIALLLASYYFYMSWNVNLIVLIGGTTLVSYGSGVLSEKTQNKKLKLFYMLFSVISSLLVLFFFKYFNFFSQSVVDVLRVFGIPASDFSLKFLLPVGISFYTFQTLSYSIDVYKGKIKAEKHLGYYALFVSFFPQLVAGPIERPENLLPQLKEKKEISSQNIVIGLQYMLVGFFKKVVVADTVSIFVNSIFNDMKNVNGLTALVAVLLFSLQILCDFDGYTSIAIGAAKMMNINLVRNFNNPYTALSIKDFWSRWHISLSTWFTDYLYIPLGGSRVGKARHLFNLFLTFLLSGLWHGAAWTFVVWGALHGLYQIVGNLTAKPKRRLYDKIGLKEDSGVLILGKRICTYLLVCFAWIFFRANSLPDAFHIIGNIFTGWNFSISFITESFTMLNMNALTLLLTLMMIVCLIWLPKGFEGDKRQFYFQNENTSVYAVRKVLYFVLLCAVIFAWIYVVSVLGYENGFIYFQF